MASDRTDVVVAPSSGGSEASLPDTRAASVASVLRHAAVNVAHQDIPKMIRKATTADRPRISDVRLAVRENVLSNPGKIEQTALWIYENSAFWVWEQDGAVQGFSAADPRDGTIFALFVHPDYEGRGIGRTLLPLACDELRAAGHSVATLNTVAGTRAERFYREDGWTEVGRKEDGQIVFRKPL